MCSAGYFCIGGLSAPQACPAGFFLPSPGSVSRTNCTHCKTGKFSTGLGIATAKTCESCKSGMYQTGFGGSTCDLCLPGSYAISPGMSSCLLCGSGKVQARTGASRCLDCVPGKFQPSRGKSLCMICGKGTYTSTMGTATSNCMSCTAGKYQSETGSSSCVECPLLMSSREGASSCEPCTSVQKKDFPTCSGTTSCTFDHCNTSSACPGAGTFCVVPKCADSGGPFPTGRRSGPPAPPASDNCGFGNMVKCPAGYFCEGGLKGYCPEGVFCPEGATKMQPCPAGFCCPTGSPSPQTCLAGTYCNAPELSFGIECPAGYFCPISSSAPTPCPPGYFCPAATGSPFPCSAGAYCPAGASAQWPCPAGHYCPLGALMPVPCPGGLLNCPTDAMECPSDAPSCSLCVIGGDKCGPGTYCPKADNGPQRRLCPAGSYCPGGTAAPIPCKDASLCPYIPYYGLSKPLRCRNEYPSYSSDKQFKNYEKHCWPGSASSDVLCVDATKSYCLVVFGDQPKQVQYVLTLLLRWNAILDTTLKGTFDESVYSDFFSSNRLSAPWSTQSVNGVAYLPLTPCAAPGAVPVHICDSNSIRYRDGLSRSVCYGSYRVPIGMVQDGGYFPLQCGQGNVCRSDAALPDEIGWIDQFKCKGWTQASGGRSCRPSSNDCIGLSTDAQAVWNITLRNQWYPALIPCNYIPNAPCGGADCLNSVTWTRH